MSTWRNPLSLTENELAEALSNEYKENMLYSQEIADELKKYDEKIDWLSRLWFGARFVTKHPRLCPVKIYYAEVSKPIEMYKLQRNKNGGFYKSRIPEIGMSAGSIVGKRLGGLFDFSHECGNPIKRLSEILEDENVVKVDFT